MIVLLVFFAHFSYGLVCFFPGKGSRVLHMVSTLLCFSNINTGHVSYSRFSAGYIELITCKEKALITLQIKLHLLRASSKRAGSGPRLVINVGLFGWSCSADPVWLAEDGPGDGEFEFCKAQVMRCPWLSSAAPVPADGGFR